MILAISRTLLLLHLLLVLWMSFLARSCCDSLTSLLSRVSGIWEWYFRENEDTWGNWNVLSWNTLFKVLIFSFFYHLQQMGEPVTFFQFLIILILPQAILLSLGARSAVSGYKRRVILIEEQLKTWIKYKKNYTLYSKRANEVRDSILDWSLIPYSFLPFYLFLAHPLFDL